MEGDELDQRIEEVLGEIDAAALKMFESLTQMADRVKTAAMLYLPAGPVN